MPLMFACNNIRFSWSEAHIIRIHHKCEGKIEKSADAQAGLHLCCSQPRKTGFLALRPILQRNDRKMTPIIPL